jgi:hypothetical protein
MSDAAPPPVPSINVTEVMAEIEDEVRIRRAAGDLPVARERELDELFLAHSPLSGYGGNLSDALARVDGAMFVDPVVPIDSNRRAGAVVKRGMRSLSLWYIGWLTHQINQFASATGRSLHIIEQRLDDLERITDVQRVPRAPVVEFPDLHRPDAWWVDVAVAAVAATPGRTLHAAGGDGWLVRRIEAAGGDAYGVDARGDRVERDLSGTDVRVGDLAGHLRAVAPGALGAVILSGVVDGMAAGERSELLHLIASGLGREGVLVLHSATAASWHRPDAPVEADLSPGRPLRGESWCALLADHGFHASVQHGPAEADFLVVAARRATHLPETPLAP